MSPRLATFLIFLANGAMIGAWLANIPWIAGHLDATKTEVGIALVKEAKRREVRARAVHQAQVAA